MRAGQKKYLYIDVRNRIITRMESSGYCFSDHNANYTILAMRWIGIHLPRLLFDTTCQPHVWVVFVRADATAGLTYFVHLLLIPGRA